MEGKHLKKLAHSITDMNGYEINLIVKELKEIYDVKEICKEIINITRTIEIDIYSANLLLNILNNNLPQLSEYCTDITVAKFLNNGFVLGKDFSFTNDGKVLLSSNLNQWILSNYPTAKILIKTKNNNVNEQ